MACLHGAGGEKGGSKADQTVEAYVELALETDPDGFRLRLITGGRVEFEDSAGVQGLRTDRSHLGLVDTALSSVGFGAQVATRGQCEIWATEHGSLTVTDFRDPQGPVVLELQLGCRDEGYAAAVDRISHQTGTVDHYQMGVNTHGVSPGAIAEWGRSAPNFAIFNAWSYEYQAQF